MNGQMEIVFWDVQHGNATYIKSPNGKNIVVDLGTGDYSGRDEKFSPLMWLKRKHGVQQIDYCIITHPHMDHIDDIMNFDELAPKILSRPRHISDDDLRKGVRIWELPKIDKYIEINKRYTGTLEEFDPSNPKYPENYGGMEIRSFHPVNCSTSNLNNQSIVTVFKYANIKVVIPGDNEQASWNELLENPEFVSSISNSDIYLASHHGRESGYHEEIIDLINPRLTIISDGSYHDNSVREEYTTKSRGWKVYKKNQPIQRKTLSTYHDGEITISIGFNSSSGKSYLRVDIG